MFTSLLSNLQSLISTRFLVASFLPMLAFGFANALMLFWLNAPFHDYVVANADLGAGLASLIVAAVLIGLAFLAYGAAALLPSVQALMEGNWPSRIASAFTPAQMNRYDRLEREMRTSGRLYGSFSTVSDSTRLREAWRQRLGDARPLGAGKGNGYVTGAASAQQVYALHRLQQQGRVLTDREVGPAVDALRAALAEHDAGLGGPDGDRALEFIHFSLLDVIDRMQANAARCKGERELLERQLTDARRAGNARRANAYQPTQDLARTMQTLADKRRRAEPITAAELRAAVGALVPQLRANNADIGSRDLEDARQLLWDLIDYAEQYATSQFRSRAVTLHFEYGSLPLAPTRMGNVAKTVQNYTVRRYDFNFEFLWSRLQIYARRDKDFGPTLRAAKTQLDFLVSCSALTLFWSLGWSVWLAVSRGPALVFLAVALLGPLAFFLWYRVAGAQYRTVADLLRSSVDLFRFDLLNALHYPLPGSVQEECDLWRLIDGLHTRYELRDLRYVPAKSS